MGEMIGKIMLGIIRLLVIAGLLFCIFNIVAPEYYFSLPVYKEVISIALSAVVLLAISYFVNKIKGKSVYKIFRIIMWVIWIMIQVVYIYVSYSTYNADAAAVREIVNAYLSPDKVLVEGNFYFDYLCRYVNNIPIVILEYIVIRAARVLGFAMSLESECLLLCILAGVFADLAILFTSILTNKLAGKDASTIAFLLSVFLVGLSEPATILYTDIVSLWTIPASWFFILCAFDYEGKKRITFVILSSVIASIGILFKPQAIIVLIAAFVISIVFALLKKELKGKKYILLFVIVSLLLYKAEGGIVDNWTYGHIASKEYIEDHEFVFWHYLNMGLNDEHKGAYYAPDVDLMWNTIGKQEKKEACIASIRNRLDSRSFNELIMFWKEKVVGAIHDGSFSAPTIWKGDLINTDARYVGIQDILIPKNGGWTRGIGRIVQTLYVLLFGAVLVSICMNIIRGNKSGIIRKLFTDIVGLSILGDLLFILLLEQNHRYLYIMLPLMIVETAIVFQVIGRGNNE
ncbi:hypothetical protein [Butyrivibrio sp. FC2001]|uniref:hypothetical protein n=1 Tax=Butyrivibrio sp. FC2001 TaxID=1280671 RepID=UPI001A9A21E0|nr:hypothetical protein [Butyrivibrio sp. FC2001]